MLGHNVLFWNVRGLNSRARRDVVREFLLQECSTVACLVETKVNVLSTSMVYDLMGTGFDYLCLPCVGASGGIVVASLLENRYLVDVQNL
jgi:exonuclease III